MSLPYAYYAANLRKKPEQTYERILRSKTYVRTNGRTEANLKVPTASGGGPKIIQKGFQTLLGQNMQKMLILSKFGTFLHNMTPLKGDKNWSHMAQ